MSAKVIKSSEGLTARQILGITSRSDATPLKDVEHGTVIPYCGFIEQEIVNEANGEVFNSVLLISKPDEKGDRKIYATRSESFIRSLYEIIDTLQEMNDTDPFSVKIEKLKSKNGREFVTCSLAE